MQLKKLAFLTILSFVSSAAVAGCGEATEPTQPDGQAQTQVQPLGGDVPPEDVEVDCPGDKVTGGGHIYRFAGNAKVTFGLVAIVGNDDVHGHVTVVDHWSGGPIVLNSTELTGYSEPREGTRIISGIANVNDKTGVEFAVKVVDNGEPGDQDRFFLVYDGYQTSGWLLGGNITIDEPEVCEPFPGTCEPQPDDDLTCPGDAEPICPPVDDDDDELDDGDDGMDDGMDDGDGALLSGCTQGFWKTHTELWDEPGDPYAVDAGFTADTSFNAYFGLTPAQSGFADEVMMYHAINMGGGFEAKLARHGIAALLNIASEYDYRLTNDVDWLRNAIRQALIDDEFEPLATDLDMANNEVECRVD